jgi:hypothetical protein
LIIIKISLFILILSGGCSGEKSVKSQPDSRAAAKRDSAPQKTEKDKEKTVAEYEFIDNIMLIPVELSGFDTLCDDLKKELWLKSIKAYKQGREMYNFNAPLNLRIVKIMEEIVKNGRGISFEIKNKIKRYLLKFWMHRGNVNLITGEKFYPSFIPGEFASATQIAMQNGAAIDTSDVKTASLSATRLEELEALLSLLRPVIFRQRQGGTIINTVQTGSDSDSASETNGSAASLKSDNKKIKNDQTIKNKSLQNETETQINSPPGSLVYYPNSHYTSIWNSFLPFVIAVNNRLREVGGRKSTAAKRASKEVVAVEVVAATGVFGPLWYKGDGPLGFGLSKTVDNRRLLLVNANLAFDRAMGIKLTGLFSFDENILKLRKEYRQLVRYAYWVLRETFGYGPDGTEKKPSDWLQHRLGSAYELIKDLRAELSVLFLAFDKDVKKSGLLPGEKALQAFIYEYITGTLDIMASGVGQLKTDTKQMARIMIFNYLAKNGIIEVLPKGTNSLTVKIEDMNRIKGYAEKLLATVRRIRFAGNGPSARELIAEFAKVNVKWQSVLKKRFAENKFAEHFAFIYPQLQAKTEKNGSKNIVLNPISGFYSCNLQLSDETSFETE